MASFFGRMPLVFNVQYLIELPAHGGIGAAADGDGARGVGFGRKPLVSTCGNGWGRTRRLAGSGCAWLSTEGVEQAHSASAETLTASKFCNVFTGVSQVVVDAGQRGHVRGAGLVDGFDLRFDVAGAGISSSKLGARLHAQLPLDAAHPARRKDGQGDGELGEWAHGVRRRRRGRSARAQPPGRPQAQPQAQRQA